MCFDVDSTVCLDEGIDELADFCGAGQAVAEWTTKQLSQFLEYVSCLAYNIFRKTTWPYYSQGDDRDRSI